jgi:ribonuclease HI
MLTFLKVDDPDPEADTSAPRSAEGYPDAVLEALHYLLSRSDEQASQLVKLSTDLQYLLDRSREQWAKLSSECDKAGQTRDQQIEDLYSNSVRLAETVHHQAEHIKYLEARLNRLAESLILVARKSPQQSMQAKLATWFMAWSPR